MTMPGGGMITVEVAKLLCVPRQAARNRVRTFPAPIEHPRWAAHGVVDSLIAALIRRCPVRVRPCMGASRCCLNTSRTLPEIDTGVSRTGGVT
jgi:hypothetical protein